METVEAIKSSASVTAAAAEERDQAVTEEQQAAADLLQMVIDVVRPVLRAIADGCEGNRVFAPDGTERKDVSRRRYVRIHGIGGGPQLLYLADDGTLCEYRYERDSGGNAINVRIYEYEQPGDIFADGWQIKCTELVAETLAAKLGEAAPGLKARAEKARKNAARLRAVAELLRK